MITVRSVDITGEAIRRLSSNQVIVAITSATVSEALHGWRVNDVQVDSGSIARISVCVDVECAGSVRVSVTLLGVSLATLEIQVSRG